MALDMFIKIGTLTGESKDKTHSGEIDVLAWSWGVSNSGSAHVGGGAGAGKANVQDLSLTKWVDLSSPELLLACLKGTHYDTAKLTLRKAGGDSPVEYLVIELKEVLVTSVATGGSGGEDRLTENVTLNFASVKVTYTEQTEKGATAKKPEMGWNITQNAEE